MASVARSLIGAFVVFLAGLPHLGWAQTNPFEARPPLAPLRVIEGIEILGNARTARSVVLDQLSLREGDVVDTARVEASRVRLLSTGFFRSVEFSLRRGSRRGQVLLVIALEERSTLRFEDVGFGFGPGNEPFVALGLAETNFLGRGVTVGGSVALGPDRRAFDVRLFHPNLANTGLQLAGSAIWIVGQELIDPSLEDESPRLAYERLGGTLGLGFGPGPAQRISFVYRLEAVTTEPLPNLDPPVLRRAPSILDGASVLSSLGATWERDTRDDAFAPSRGVRWAAAVEVGTSLLGSDYEFSKYSGEVEAAFRLLGDQALVLRAFGGLVQGEAPFFVQYFARDFSRFGYGVPALPRAVRLNFSQNNDYDDLLLDAGVTWTLPLLGEPTLGFDRILIYLAVDFTVSGSLEERQDDVGGRSAFVTFPVTFDAGLKLDTELGRFVLSMAYALDLFL